MILTHTLTGGYGNFVSAFEQALILLPIRSRLGKHLWPAVEVLADKARPYRNEIDFWIQVSSSLMMGSAERSS